ncbi:ARM repeat-containing protein [Gigaspora margarita]|uniref:ARM repeat-containing protein n=1 Tax=Gigaspora margarita TaxID=4874 RepID=A0A8H3XC71_GIGMA|nr:ARM repeat-containing protein [Gigaspora margarita]
MEEAENNEIPTLLKNSEEIFNNGQNIISNKNSDKVEEKLPSVSRKKKRSVFDDQNHISSKLDPGHRLEIKKRWEITRRKNLSSEEQNKSVTSLFELVHGNVPGLFFKNNTSRVLEICLKYGNKEQKSIIASKLEGRLLEASKNKYAKYIVCKLMKFCSEYRCKILTEFKGQVKKLFLHTEARIVLERTEILNIKDLIAENPSNKDKILKNLF